MLIGIPRERFAGETRVAATPEMVKKYIAAKHGVIVEGSAGVAAHYPDDAYVEAGATIGSLEQTLAADLIIKVRGPDDAELVHIKPGTVLVGMLEPYNETGIDILAKAGVTAFALEAVPRITRAQSLDVLSSQANLAGYKAVLLAANHYGRLFPMMMTAAGTLKAARTVVLGAGVAGLQAIATAKRLGAVVEASDVRPTAQEQVESLGAKFIEVPFETDEERDIAEGIGGYARAMPAAWMARQAERVSERCKQADIVITTALIPGRPAPTLIDEETVKSMKPGSVIVDMAVERGGNCPLSEKDKVVEKHGVTIVGYSNLPAMVPTDASALYARNVFDFIKLISNAEGALDIQHDDEIVAACLMSSDGTVTRRA